LHPDGSKTEKYPFKGGDTKDAYRLMSEEIKKKKNSRAASVLGECRSFLADRRQGASRVDVDVDVDVVVSGITQFLKSR
jgi:hypothetical protein